MARLARALAIYNDKTFRQALMNEGTYREQVIRYGMKPIGYFHWLWQEAYGQARYEEKAIEAQEADGPYGRIVTMPRICRKVKYPNIFRILKLLGENSCGGDERPYPFPYIPEKARAILEAVEFAASKYKTDIELEERLYGVDGEEPTAPYSILDQFTNWVFDSGEWESWNAYAR